MTPEQILDAPDLIAVGMAGDDVRRRLRGATTTFVRVLEVHVEAHLHGLPPRAQPGEIRIIGVPSSREAALAAVRSAREFAGGVPVTGFSVADLIPLGPLAETARLLKEAGLGAVAQLPIDTVEAPERVVAQIRDGGLTVNTITLHHLEDEARLELCERARTLQGATGGFHTFAPLPRITPVAKPTTGYDDVKLISLARVVVTNVPSIQVDWQLYGPKMAQVALTVGADDVDNVSAVDPGILGTRRSPLEEIRQNIKAAGFDPLERNGLFVAA